MDKFAEAQERAEEEMDMAVTAPREGRTFEDRKRREADADAQVLLTQPLHYAPNYPYYFVNNLVPTVKKVDEDQNMEMLMADETGKKVEDTEMKAAPQQYYLPLYAPSYYYPSLIQYPAATTVTRTVSPWYQYPLSYPGLVPQVQQPTNPAEERILPSETQAGENEIAALLL